MEMYYPINVISSSLYLHYIRVRPTNIKRNDGQHHAFYECVWLHVVDRDSGICLRMERGNLFLIISFPIYVCVKNNEQIKMPRAS